MRLGKTRNAETGSRYGMCMDGPSKYIIQSQVLMKQFNDYIGRETSLGPPHKPEDYENVLLQLNLLVS